MQLLSAKICVSMPKLRSGGTFQKDTRRMEMLMLRRLGFWKLEVVARGFYRGERLNPNALGRGRF